MSPHLQDLEKKSIRILREARDRFEKVGFLFSGGKDCMVSAYLCRRAFFGKIPFTAIYIHHGSDFPETYKFVDEVSRRWGFKVIESIAPKVRDPLTKTTEGINKVDALKKAVAENSFDALVISIRKDESEARARERYFSPRDENFGWDPDTPPQTISHWRIHPLLDWREINIWQYTKEENIPVHPLYFSKKGKRFRSLGFPESTLPVESEAQTLDEIISEVKGSQVPERSGRAQDKEQVMERLRRLGYM